MSALALAWMAAGDDLSEVLDGDAGVEGRGVDALVAEQGLDVADVGAAGEKMRRAGVAQDVGRDPHGERECFAIAGEELVDGVDGHPSSGLRGDEEGGALECSRELRTAVG